MSQSVRLLSYRDLEAAGYGSRVTIWRRVRNKEFPAPIDLGHGRIGWRESTILEWVESREIAQIGRAAAG